MRTLRRMRYRVHLVKCRRVVGAAVLAVFVLVTLLLTLMTVMSRMPTPFMSMTRRPVSVIVVEEHHEVLPYWIQAANEGIIPKSGNTLVHIDGHSDEALPQLLDQMPFFVWPSTDDQVQTLLQRNDVFIQAAVMSGLIDRIVFIYPSWDSSTESIYEKKTVGLGWMHLTVDGAVEKHLCVCAQMIDGGLKDCLYEDPSPQKADPEVELEDPSKCNIMKHYTVEHVVEFVALDKLQKEKDWLGEPQNVILDIDEDYFGCELGAKVLIDAGVRWKPVLKLSRQIAEFFCPKSIEHESLSNHVMHTVMKAMIKNNSNRLQNLQMCNAASVKMHSIAKSIIKKFLRDEPSIFCLDDKTEQDETENDETKNDKTEHRSVEDRWGSVMSSLCVFSLREFEAVMDLGFCLSMSPASTGFSTQGQGVLQVCHGSNIPNDTVVFLHSPEVNEVEGRMTHLNEMLRIVDTVNPPKFVTVCRSVRDGYTPREHFTRIESGIVKIFQQLSMPYRVSYDQNLLGGRGGWPDRHNIITPKKLKLRLPAT